MAQGSEPATEGGSQTLARGLQALTLIGEASAPLGVADLARELGIHRSMVYRMVRTLEQHGFVEKLPSGQLSLGARLSALAHAVSKDLREAAAPQLAAIADELTMTALVVVYDGQAAVTLSHAEPRNVGAAFALRPGSRHSINHGAPGRVIRSQLQPAEYPAQDYESSINEVVPGLASIAVPIRLPQGKPAALAVLCLPQELDAQKVAEVLTLASARISASMGLRI